MPVSRYRDISDMPPPPRPLAKDLLQAIAAAWEQAHISLPPDVPRGVVRYRSLEAAQRDRDRREVERIRQLRSTRHANR